MSYLGNQIRGGSMVAERFSGNGSETEFSLNHDYGNEASVLVTISGVKQTTDTSVSDKAIEIFHSLTYNEIHTCV